MSRFTKRPESFTRHYKKEEIEATHLFAVTLENPVAAYHHLTRANTRLHLGDFNGAARDYEDALAGIENTRFAYMEPYVIRMLDRMERTLAGLNNVESRRANWLEYLESIERKKGPQLPVRKALRFPPPAEDIQDQWMSPAAG